MTVRLRILVSPVLLVHSVLLIRANVLVVVVVGYGQNVPTVVSVGVSSASKLNSLPLRLGLQLLKIYGTCSYFLQVQAPFPCKPRQVRIIILM